MMTLCVVSSQAQIVKFGVKGGLNLNDMHIENGIDASSKAGFFIGPTIKVGLPLTGLDIDASALFDYRSAKLDVNDGVDNHKETVKQQQIAIPVNLRYGFGLGDAASIFFFAGPQFGFAIGDKEQSLCHDVAEWKLKTSNFSVNVGAGVMILEHLQVSANYNIACGTTGELSIKDIGKGAAKGKNNSWQVGVAYYF